MAAGWSKTARDVMGNLRDVVILGKRGGYDDGDALLGNVCDHVVTFSRFAADPSQERLGARRLKDLIQRLKADPGRPGRRGPCRRHQPARRSRWLPRPARSGRPAYRRSRQAARQGRSGSTDTVPVSPILWFSVLALALCVASSSGGSRSGSGIPRALEAAVLASGVARAGWTTHGASRRAFE
jgi:hypothetical protein